MKEVIFVDTASKTKNISRNIIIGITVVIGVLFLYFFMAPDNIMNEASVTSYLNGTWERKDLTSLSGTVIRIDISSDEQVGTLVSVPRNKFGFVIGDRKWSYIKIINKNTFEFNDMYKSAGYTASLGTMTYKSEGKVSFKKAKGAIDYAQNTITIDTTGYNNDEGNYQVWYKIN